MVGEDLKKSEVIKILGITGKKVYCFSELRFNSLLNVKNCKYVEEGNYFNLDNSLKETLIKYDDLLKDRTPRIQSEENLSVYLSKGTLNGVPPVCTKIRRTIRWGILFSKSCKIPTPKYYFREHAIADIVSNATKKASSGGYSWLHRGHMIGKDILRKVKIEEQFLEKSNMNNIYLQTEQANLHSKDYYGQKYFEDEVIKLFDVLEPDKQIYYEVESVFSSKNDRIPIGNKLQCFKILEDRIEKKFFVFIPNYQKGKKINYKDGY